MSRDPFYEVQDSVESALSTFSSLPSQSDRKGTLASLEVDIETLEESIRVCEEAGDLFGLDEKTLADRRRFVRRVKGEVEAIRRTLPSAASRPASTNPYSNDDEYRRSIDDVESWEREEQAFLIRGQDRTLDSISGTVQTLRDQASLAGREINEQNVMIEDLSADVDSTQSKLDGAMRKMQRFIAETERKGSGWCIGILTVILVLLLLAVILL